MQEYVYSHDRTPQASIIWRPLQRLLAKHAPPPRRLFELGCGNGATARALAEIGYDVVGIDPSTSGIAQASRHASARLHFEAASTADDLRGRFGEFPVAISVEVIEHCPSAREFMNALRSVLAPGGIGIISTPYHGYLKNLLVVASGRFDRHFDPLWEGGHIRFFSVSKLRALLAETQFTPLSFHRVGRLPVIAKSVIAVFQRKD